MGSCYAGSLAGPNHFDMIDGSFNILRAILAALRCSRL
jgi:hypothetical protein